ncbi:MAG TPA: methyltransferase [Chloroflexaceae bacterium]|nr:methyltransferase [Chloroflexaceae bacterium]
MSGRIAIAAYGVVCYLVGAGAYFIGLAGFVGNFLGPYSIDAGPPTSPGLALLVNGGLIVLFGLPHSLMARRGFKRWWTRLVPPAAERSTFMLQSGLMALLLIWQWRPLPGVIWSVEGTPAAPLLWAVFWLGWLIALIATFLINHFELTGLQQVYAHLRGLPAAAPGFRTPFLYRVVRHPMQLGVLLAFWATPRMTVGHLVFALGMTAYILVGLFFEERDLVRAFGRQYEAYRAATPMLIPRPWPRRRPAAERPGVARPEA